MPFRSDQRTAMNVLKRPDDIIEVISITDKYNEICLEEALNMFFKENFDCIAVNDISILSFLNNH